MIASPPAWVLALSLDSGSWRCLVGLWTWADYGASGPAHVWPTREQLAQRTGQSLEAIKKQLRKLAVEGLIESAERGWVLAWRGPASPDGGLSSPARGPASPGNPVPGEGTSVPAEGNPIPGEGTSVPGHLTSHDLANPGSDPAAAPARDDRAGRHLAIVEQQRELAERRAQTRAELAEADPRRAVTREHIAAVRDAGAAWAQMADRDPWVRSLGEAIRELKGDLGPEQVALVLAAWDRAAEAAGGPLAVERDDGRTLGVPPRRALWWGRWRAWVAGAALPEGQALRQRSRGGLGCDWADDSDLAATRFMGVESW